MRTIGRTMLLALATVLAACSEGTVAPRSPQVAQTGAAYGGGATADLSGWDTLRFSFTIDPSRSTYYYLGAGNSITFPAGSLCDPSSSYGPTEWDKACAIASAPVTINAKAWLDSHGHPRIDFDKHVRFAPSSNPAKWVMLSFTDYGAAWGLNAKILYCTGVSSGCVDEAKLDPTLATVRDPVTGRMTRRIKHFSGYNVFSGEPCIPSPDDPDCISDGSDATDAVFNRSASSSTHVAPLKSVTPLVRGHTLPDHPTKSADIGPLGGELRLPQAGLTLVVPPGAVSSVTHFSVTATGGRIVAYEFEPHGTHFNVPLLLKQDLRGTEQKWGGHIVGGYFADPSQLDLNGGKSFVNETLNATIDAILNQATIEIWHFSGYMLAWG